jgi:hypothetical protein
MSLLALGIAGVRIDLRSPDPEPPGLARLHPFAGAAGAAGWTLELSGEVQAAPAPGRALVVAGGRWCLAGLERSAWIDPATRSGAAPADPGCLALDALLRAAVGTTVLADGGLLLPAASIAVDGAAHLFPARSQSGKSTLASRAGHPLADEVSLLRRSPGGWVAHATPWWRSRGGAAPLAGIYELAWDGEAVTPLPGSALRLLATTLVLPLERPEDWARGLATAAELARDVPFARLAFRPDSDVDALLRAARGTA